MTHWKSDEATKQYIREQSQQWQKPLTANLRSLDADAGRLKREDAIVVSPRGVGARVGDLKPEQKFQELKQERDRSDSYYERHRPDGTPWPPGWSTSKANALTQEFLRMAAEKQAKKPQGDRADSSGYRQDDFSMQDADCWEQGQWVCAYSDGKLLKWRRKDAPAEVLARLQA